ncbi:MAG: aminotransferase class IV [Gemmataceae bacterium]|nr:aminotransferase class IV [Gemmata sp.]MDW8197319.1 aminotransferase class IV [Gemmataceae bacterium]
MKQPLVYYNGRFIPFAEAALPLDDAGFVSGATIVDNARTFRHKLFRWPDHLARFRQDCAACYVPLEWTDAELTAIAEELVAQNAPFVPPGGEFQLVTFATPGPVGYYRSAAKDAAGGESSSRRGTLGMLTYPLPWKRYQKFFTHGVTLAIAGIQPTDQLALVPPRIKHRSRLHWHVAAQVIRDPHSDYHWQLDPPASDPSVVPVVINGSSADTAIGSIIAVFGETVIFPDERNVQKSISVQVIRELCDTLGLKHSTAALDISGLVRPDWREGLTAHEPLPTELLLAGTAFCVAGVRRWGVRDRYCDFVWPGPLLRRLQAAWSEIVGVDIVQQFVGGETPVDAGRTSN